jgi:thiamine-phosphate pyrophosphorylase
MVRYYITNRHDGDVIDNATRAIKDGIEMIQVREKDLPTRELLALTCHIRDLAIGSSTKVLVNDRLDIALAAGLDGVHLPAAGLPVAAVRPHLRVVGVSVHSVEEAAAAEQAGADFVVFGPVFETPGKTPAGIAALREVVLAMKIPVLGIGGINMTNMNTVLETGAAGIAAIRMFQRQR